MVMKGLSPGTEILQFSRDRDDSNWYVFQLAINGIPCVPFSVSAPDILPMLDHEEQLMAYLERQAAAMIESCGDARNPKQDAFSEYQGAA
jgi:hypothetical protein